VFETNFTERNYVKIPAYTKYATNRPDGIAHASSAILIIKHHELAKHETAHIQATNISIEDWDENLTILATYCPRATQLK
jgi:hypothetical protein